LLVQPDKPKAFADAIGWLFTHPDEAREMGKRGQQRVYGHFYAERMADEMIALYDKVMSMKDGLGGRLQ
jgi:glycosyltransferase involved in cell wall biosynthesis